MFLAAPHCFVFPGKNSSGTKYMAPNTTGNSNGTDCFILRHSKFAGVVSDFRRLIWCLVKSLRYELSRVGLVTLVYYRCQLRVGVTAPPNSRQRTRSSTR